MTAVKKVVPRPRILEAAELLDSNSSGFETPKTGLWPE
jgi:hypothetical protein